MAVLYAATGGSSNSDLYTINPVSGVATSVGAIGFAVTGLAFDPTGGPTLYGVTSNNSPLNPRSLITINTSTGAGTLVGALGIATPCPDISCNSAGQLYGWADGPDQVLSINKSTGAATPVGDTSINSSGDGMGFDGNDILYAFLTNIDGKYYQLNTATGNAYPVATMSNQPGGSTAHNIPGADFDDTGALWMIVGNMSPVPLCTVSRTGVITQHTTVAVAGLDAIAWSGTKGVFGGAPPANDDFADAETLTDGDAIEGTVAGSTLQLEAGEPVPAGDAVGTIWYSYTAAATTTVTVTTGPPAGVGEIDHSWIEVFTGASVGALTPVAEGDYIGGGSFYSQIALEVTEGVTYYIRVRASAGTFTGSFALTLVGPQAIEGVVIAFSDSDTTLERFPEWTRVDV